MLILASESPRRRELIKRITNDFTVIPSNVDESLLHITPHDLPAELSKLKAYSVFSKYPNDEVLACDTVVILNGELMGKPRNKKEAFDMLSKLSNKKHVVISGYTYISKDKEITRTVRTYVYFNKLSDELINKYIESGSPMDKAGAYGIQDQEFNLVNHIEGDFDNVIGLPVEDIKKHVFDN
jgi:septum formation protein